MGAPPAAQEFACHRGIVPTLSVFAGLAVIELLVTHLVVALVWPRAAWWISATTLLLIVWLVRWIESFRRCPHNLTGDHLQLRMGSLRSLTLPLDNIAGIEPVTALAMARGPGVRNFVPVTMPNRLVRLRQPLPDRRRTSAIAVWLDDPAAFDSALAAALARA